VKFRIAGQLVLSAAAAVVYLTSVSKTHAVPPPAGQSAGHQARSVCEIISREARRRALPEHFFARLIWKESLFDARAVSHKGAQGIAQFMPSTAKERGLADPFEPKQALPASADLLSELARTFGNIGLAAAAYNAGEERVERWLDGQSSLPAETLDYVLSITGRHAREWKRAKAHHSMSPIGKGVDFIEDCVKLALRRAEPLRIVVARSEPAVAPKEGDGRKPWGVQIAGSHSEAAALASFDRIRARYGDVVAGFEPLVIRRRNPGMGRKRVVNVRLGAASREEANRLCDTLLSKGCACVVLKN
jgi:hypothetical protein